MTDTTTHYDFETIIAVRDYELDVQGIVNNANYLHYLEHTRHEFCKMVGTSFREMHERGIDPVLRHVSIEYLTPLMSGQEMRSCLRLNRKGPRFVFQQDIFRHPDGVPVVKAEVTVVCLENGALSRGDILAEAFEKYLR